MSKMSSVASSQLQFRCGLVLKNRLVKTAMSEKMAQALLPSSNHKKLYKRWAEGGWAALITGTAEQRASLFAISFALTMHRQHHGFRPIPWQQ
jgi:2,4-dienoyl-CoA reductase-like NADH-dependent reductase (Old Yellow Enzyme family)